MAEAPPAAAGRPAAAPVLLAGAVAAAYATSFAGTFVFDDWPAVVRDPRVQSLAAWWRSMPGIRPLLKLTYAANHQSGLGLTGFHAVNVALHAANAVLAWALLRRVGERAEPGSPATPAAALLGALLFALHPVQVEAVTYVSGRSTALAATFVLGSLLAWLRAPEGPRGRGARAASLLLFAGALAVKEYPAVLPLALLLFVALDRTAPSGWREAARRVGPHLALLAAGAAAILASPTYRRLLGVGLGLRGPWENLLTQLRAAAWLTGQMVRPDRMVADPALPAAAELTPALAAAGLALAAAVAGGLLALRRRPALAFGLLWTLLWLAPTGWLVPRRDPASERQLYLALLGPAWLLARGLAAAGPGRALRRAAAVALPLALGAATAARNLVYRDEVTYWADAAAKVPGNARAWNNLGHALACACRRDEAEAALVRAIALDPDGYRAAVNLSLLRAGEALGPDGEGLCPPPAPAAAR